jgi:hypothetical protein
MDTVRFTLNDVFAGFGEGHGLLRNEGTHLCLEYQVQDGIVGVLKSEVRQVRIPFEDVASVTLTKGWFGMNWWGVKIVIQGTRMEAFEDVPGASGGRVELSISGKDHEAAENFVYRLYSEEGSSRETSRA